MITFRENYHACERICLGGSDIASLIAVGYDCPELKTAVIGFGGDGDYIAHLCGAETVIPEHYRKVFECTGWLKIYDDYNLVYDSKEYPGFDHFAIYRAGDYGCIIQMQ